MPEDTFGVLRDLLYSLEGRLRSVQVGVERRQALAAATPTIWPTQGWLTDSFGRRSDPFTGEQAFHNGLDISTDRGQPVYATADATVQTRGVGRRLRQHGGPRPRLRDRHAIRAPSTRPGEAGHSVRRGDVIGLAGSTGRSTGDHVHYEVLANGRTLNPLRFLIDRVRR